jgi:sporulation protein YlmC with PRC-barrel domain
MSMTFTRDLDPLTSSGLELEDPTKDLRGREALDRDGESVGTVAELLIDPTLRIPRLAVVEGGGGLLGIGKKHYLVPMEAIGQDDGQTVRISRIKDEILAESEYHASEGEEEELQYAQAYQAYGIRPYWEEAPVENRSTT